MEAVTGTAGGPGALALAALLLGSYLLGAVPFALLIGLAKGVDIRKVGSGNVGATNLSRALGRGWGIAAFALDFLKGLLPVLAVGWAGGGRPWARLAEPHVCMAAGAIAILGHVFPVYLRFRGGKGVATSFGVLTGLAFWAALAAGAVWLVLFAATRTVSIASLAAALAFPVGTAVLYRTAPLAVAAPMDALATGVAALIIVRHRSNIRRLLAGSEGRF